MPAQIGHGKVHARRHAVNEIHGAFPADLIAVIKFKKCPGAVIGSSAVLANIAAAKQTIRTAAVAVSPEIEGHTVKYIKLDPAVTATVILHLVEIKIHIDLVITKIRVEAGAYDEASGGSGKPENTVIFEADILVG